MTPSERPSLLLTLVWRELVRLARRRQAAQSRILLLYFLLLGLILFAVWWSAPANPFALFHATVPPSQLRLPTTDRSIGFAQSLALVLLEAQLLFVVLLTPAYAVSAIAEEKDRATLIVLFTTELGDREIVWGKAIAKLVLVAAAIAAGIPIILLTRWYGDVSIELILSGYVLSLGTAVLCTGIGLYAACKQSDSRSAIVQAYALVLVFVAGLIIFVSFSPFAILAFQTGLPGPFQLRLDSTELRLGVACGYAFLQTLIGIWLIEQASRHLRTREPGAGPPELTAYPEPPRGRPQPVVLAPRGRASVRLPPLDDRNPLLWKERHLSTSFLLPMFRTPARWLGSIGAMVAVCLFLIGAWQLLSRAVSGLDPDEAHQFSQFQRERPAGAGWLLAAGEVAALIFLLALTGEVSAGIAGERQRATLESLLMTMLSRFAILRSKAQAVLEKWLVLGIAAAAATASAFGAAGGLECGFVMLGTLLAAYWWSLACAAWLSVRRGTPGQAFRLSLPCVVIVLGLPIIAWSETDWANPMPAIQVLLWAAIAFIALGAVTWWNAVAGLRSSRL